MTGPEDGQDGDGVPDSDPRHIDPAGDLADLVESGEFDIELADDQDPAELREFVERAEAGEFDLRADPGLEAAVRMARAMLSDAAESDDDTGQ
ncbi:hypothetical protein [Haloarcula laminariae]|uniref:hypothetical protein n=1 Tax=Haloarcula laminariae TaxID=2961577 RepID=UPI0021C903CE|nr:hypothetical protein [Halomicroarcula laminariae]